jgi:cellobiose phosphorylase
MRYGYFDDNAREYVITRPDTPLPWINYLGTDDFVGIVSNTGAGYAFYRDARLRRIIRYRYNAAPLDGGGRFLYLRDDASGDFWSPGWQPARRQLDAYACRHGLGYSLISSRRDGVAVETLYLVPPGEALEAWRVRVTNERETPARLSLFGAVEFCLWDAQDDATNFQRNYSTGEVEVAGGVVYHRTEYRERRNHFAYFASSVPGAGWDTDRDAFLGPGRGWDRPAGVEHGELSGSVAHGWQPIGAHHVALELEPGETREVVFLLGYGENPRDAKYDPPGSQQLDKRAAITVINRYREPRAVERALDELRAAWSGRLSAFEVASGDQHLDRMVNTWNPYQCMVTLNVSRSASLFEAGIGRGIGFRDANQDLLAGALLAPDRARRRLLDLAATQLPSGAAYHQYQPLTRRGNDDIGSGFNDDPLWLVLAVAAYLKETGDREVLEEQVPYDGCEGTETRLYEHLERAMAYTTERLGPHGLPLIGRADWNDCLNLNCFSEEPGESFQTTANRDGGVAESVFIAGLFVLAAGEMAALAALCDDQPGADRWSAAASAMTAAVEQHGWDGAWFRRAYDHAGEAVGSATNDEGQIYAEPQGICVMAGIGLRDGRAAQALASVRERLDTPHGTMLLQPAYSRYRVELGEISSYPPGFKENAGVFCHTNPWLTIAAAMLGDAESAAASYQRISPSRREEISDLHRCEPYVYAQVIAGRDAPTHGEARNSWLTGTAAWSYVAVTQWILGIRAEHEGLRIDPCLPRAWGEVHVTRRFRGVTYRVLLRKQPGSGGRVARLVVDGRVIEGNLLPASASASASASAPGADGRDVTVEAIFEE